MFCVVTLAGGGAWLRLVLAKSRVRRGYAVSKVTGSHSPPAAPALPSACAPSLRIGRRPPADQGRTGLAVYKA